MSEEQSENPAGPVREGGCMCGEIRYRAVGEPLQVALCHCVNCQLNSGSAFSLNVIFPHEAVTMTGSPAIYEDKGDTGEIVRRVFCGKCGTPLESRSVFSVPNYAVIKGGTFDNPGDFTPETEIYCMSALPWWVKGRDGRKCYEKLNTDAIEAAAAAEQASGN